ncbi:MAG: lipid-A-disaccharide synthase [Alphaproteobacteria bacterium]|nr:lipid-A-disaccharide synthase [Alphaproteobacteria bacterium]
MSLKVYLIAGEPSGDLLGARVMHALKKLEPDVQIFGVGGESMQTEGLQSLFNIKDLAVMGFFEVLPNLPKILAHFDDIQHDINKVKPNIIMTIDSYSFSIRVHKALKKNGCTVPHVHLVAPQVWAWNKKRAKTIGHFIDHLFCLLPNEPGYFAPYGMPATFVGHPVIEGGADKGDATVFRDEHQIPANKQILCVLPGSRSNEINYLLDDFIQAADNLVATNPDLFVVIPTVETVREKIEKKLENWQTPHLIVTGEQERYNAFAAASGAIAASGTVSLELAMAGVPHLIAYRMNPITAALARRVLKIKYVNLINLIMDAPIIPELLQENCTVPKITATMRSLLNNKQQDTHAALEKLGLESSPSEKVAQHLIKLARNT